MLRPRLTDHFGIHKPQAELDFAIPFLSEDIPLYVDPFLLWKSPSGDDVPSNSDVTLMLGQYQEALEYFRSENIKQVHGSWYYVIEDEGASVRTSPPVRLTTRE